MSETVRALVVQTLHDNPRTVQIESEWNGHRFRHTFPVADAPQLGDFVLLRAQHVFPGALPVVVAVGWEKGDG